MSAGGHGLMNKLGYAPTTAEKANPMENMFNSPFYKAMMDSVFCYNDNFDR